MWPFRRRRDLLARQRDELAREHAKSDSGRPVAADEDRQEAMWRLLREDPDPTRTMASEHPETGQMRGWSITGSTSGDGQMLFRKERKERGDAEQEVATFTGTPV